MIVWSGRGFLPIIVLFVILFLCVSIFPTENADYGFIITAFVTGIFSWYFGKQWNKKNERIVVDEKTGQRLKIKNNHTLFWIPMQYWGIIFSVFGIIILFQNSLLFGIITSLILIALIIIPLIRQNSKEKPKEKVVRKSNFGTNKKIIDSEKEVSEEEKQKLELEKERIRKEKEDPNRFMPK
jgi:hypothetical protein